MHYLAVAPSIAEQLPAYIRERIGVLLTPRNGNNAARAASYPYWAADTGCFSRGLTFRLDRYLAWLVRFRLAQSTCLFATAPDLVGEAKATWERSKYVLPVLRSLGYQAAFVGQDGLERIRIEWDAFDVLFVGGTDHWKLSEPCCDVMAEAKARGKRVHVGRVNSRARFMTARSAGADSADGTHMAYRPNVYLPKVARWLAGARCQTVLDRRCAESTELGAREVEAPSGTD